LNIQFTGFCIYMKLMVDTFAAGAEHNLTKIYIIGSDSCESKLFKLVLASQS